MARRPRSVTYDAYVQQLSDAAEAIRFLQSQYTEGELSESERETQKSLKPSTKFANVLGGLRTLNVMWVESATDTAFHLGKIADLLVEIQNRCNEFAGSISKKVGQIRAKQKSQGKLSGDEKKTLTKWAFASNASSKIGEFVPQIRQFHDTWGRALADPHNEENLLLIIEVEKARFPVPAIAAQARNMLKFLVSPGRVQSAVVSGFVAQVIEMQSWRTDEDATATVKQLSKDAIYRLVDAISATLGHVDLIEIGQSAAAKLVRALADCHNQMQVALDHIRQNPPAQWKEWVTIICQVLSPSQLADMAVQAFHVQVRIETQTEDLRRAAFRSESFGLSLAVAAYKVLAEAQILGVVSGVRDILVADVGRADTVDKAHPTENSSERCARKIFSEMSYVELSPDGRTLSQGIGKALLEARIAPMGFMSTFWMLRIFIPQINAMWVARGVELNENERVAYSIWGVVRNLLQKLANGTLYQAGQPGSEYNAWLAPMIKDHHQHQYLLWVQDQLRARATQVLCDTAQHG